MIFLHADTTLPPKTRPRHTHAWGIYGGVYRDVRIESVPRQYVFKVAAHSVFAGECTGLEVCLGLHHHERNDSYDLTLDLIDPDGHRVELWEPPEPE